VSADATQGRTGGEMSISESADMAQAERTSTLDRGARLSPGTALIAIAVLSAASWAVVVFAVVEGWAALR
jgi:hypothetical protein